MSFRGRLGGKNLHEFRKPVEDDYMIWPSHLRTSLMKIVNSALSNINSLRSSLQYPGPGSNCIGPVVTKAITSNLRRIQQSYVMFMEYSTLLNAVARKTYETPIACRLLRHASKRRGVCRLAPCMSCSRLENKRATVKRWIYIYHT